VQVVRHPSSHAGRGGIVWGRQPESVCWQAGTYQMSEAGIWGKSWRLKSGQSQTLESRADKNRLSGRSPLTPGRFGRILSREERGLPNLQKRRRY